MVHELEAFIGKASKGDVVVCYFEPLGNAAYGSLRLAPWVKFDDETMVSALGIENIIKFHARSD